MAAKPEQRLWDWLSDAMVGVWLADRHEGTPNVADVSFSCNGCDGWIELKVARHRPLRYGAFDLSQEHFTPGQRNWLQKRGERGSGHCFVLIRIPLDKFNRMGVNHFEYLLLHWSQIKNLGHYTLHDLREESTLHWTGQLNAGAFADAICLKRHGQGIR